MQRIYFPLLITGITLICYGYLCRLIQAYLFWESRFIGWMVLLLGIIFWLLSRIPKRRDIGKKTILEKIAIGLLSFFLLVQVILLFVFPSSAAYAATKTHLRNEERLFYEVGPIVSFTVIPTGSLQEYSSKEGDAGVAEFHIIVKGEKAYKDVDIQIAKELDGEWTVVNEEW